MPNLPLCARARVKLESAKLSTGGLKCLGAAALLADLDR